MMKINPVFVGWWMLVSLGRDSRGHFNRKLVKVRAGDEFDYEVCRGPFKSRRIAEDEWMWHDMTSAYWWAGLPIYADHCLGCGRYAKVLAFDDAAGWAWRVTECRKCGVLDSRN